MVVIKCRVRPRAGVPLGRDGRARESQCRACCYGEAGVQACCSYARGCLSTPLDTQEKNSLAGSPAAPTHTALRCPVRAVLHLFDSIHPTVSRLVSPAIPQTHELYREHATSDVHFTKGNQHNQVSPVFVETQQSPSTPEWPSKCTCRGARRGTGVGRWGALLACCNHSRDPRKVERGELSQ